MSNLVFMQDSSGNRISCRTLLKLASTDPNFKEELVSLSSSINGNEDSGDTFKAAILILKKNREKFCRKKGNGEAS